MDNLIQVINRLQSACTALGDNAASDKSLPGLWSLLPTIVVIGGQVPVPLSTTHVPHHLLAPPVIWQVVGARGRGGP